MVILNGFLLQLGTILGFECETFVISVVRFAKFFQLRNIMVEKGILTERTFAIRPTRGVHLQKPNINAKLNFLAAIFAFKFSDDDLSRLVIPVFQDVRNVETHIANMNGTQAQVNAVSGICY